jgi:hypothetical protein
MTGTIDDTRIAQIQAIIEPEYSGLVPHGNGSNRDTFATFWHPDPSDKSRKEKRFGRVRKKIISNNKARTNESKGYNTDREIDILLALNNSERRPEAHNLEALLDVKRGEIDGEEVTISLSTFIPNAQTLNERVAKEGPLVKGEIVKVYSDVLGAMSYLRKAGLFHRDLTPSNILVNSSGRGFVVDLGMAKKVDDQSTDSSMPTQFSSFMSDPRLKTTSYDEQAEIFAFGANLYYGTTGKFLELQNLNPKEQTKYLKKALRAVPRKWRSIVKGCINPDLHSRYQKIEEIIDDFEGKDSKQVLKLAGVAAGMVMAVMSVGAVISGNREKDLERKLQEAEKTYHVNTDWDGRSVKITNNLVDAQAMAYFVGKMPEGNQRPYTSHFGRYGTDGKFIRIPIEEYKSGKNVSVTITARKMPGAKSHGPSAFTGRVYFEGFEGKEFTVYNENHDQSMGFDGGPHGMTCAMTHVDLPPIEDFGKVRNIAVELFAPPKIDNKDTSSSTTWNSSSEENFVFRNPETVISRFLIPVVLGDMPSTEEEASEAIVPGNVNLSIITPAIVGFRRVDSEMGYIPTDLRGVAMLSQDEWVESLSDRFSSRNAFTARFSLPKTDKVGERTMIVGAYNNRGELITYTGIPLEVKDYTYRENGRNADIPPQYGWFVDKSPPKSFYQDLLDGQKKIPKRIDPLKVEDKK